MTGKRVMIATPTSKIKDYCLMEWLMNVRKFTDPYELWIADNTPDKGEYTDMLRALGINVIKIDPTGKTNQYYIWESQDALRQVFMKGDYDYYFSLESDILPPPDVIDRLLSHNLPVVGAVYFIDHGRASYPLIQQFRPSLIPEVDYEGYNVHPIHSFLMMDGKVKESGGNGIGCTMISREVLSEVPFRYVQGHINHADSFFYEDLFAMGIPNYIDTSILLIHHNSNWGQIKDMNKDFFIVKN